MMRLRQSAKASLPIVLRPSGREISVSFSQPWKTPFPNEARLVGKDMEVRARQNWKASFPKLVTPSGRAMLVRLSQYLNVEFPIEVRVGRKGNTGEAIAVCER